MVRCEEGFPVVARVSYTNPPTLAIQDREHEARRDEVVLEAPEESRAGAREARSVHVVDLARQSYAMVFAWWNSCIIRPHCVADGRAGGGTEDEQGRGRLQVHIAVFCVAWNSFPSFVRPFLSQVRLVHLNLALSCRSFPIKKSLDDRRGVGGGWFLHRPERHRDGSWRGQGPIRALRVIAVRRNYSQLRRNLRISRVASEIVFQPWHPETARRCQRYDGSNGCLSRHSKNIHVERVCSRVFFPKFMLKKLFLVCNCVQSRHLCSVSQP